MTQTKVISLFNQAGGVGKTTITLNLGYHLAQRGNKILLIDLDPRNFDIKEATNYGIN